MPRSGISGQNTTRLLTLVRTALLVSRVVVVPLHGASPSVRGVECSASLPTLDVGILLTVAVLWYVFCLSLYEYPVGSSTVCEIGAAFFFHETV